MSQKTALATLIDILVAHQRHRGDCLCGPLPLGSSHAAHVASIIKEKLPHLTDEAPIQAEVLGYIKGKRNEQGSLYLGGALYKAPPQPDGESFIIALITVNEAK